MAARVRETRYRRPARAVMLGLTLVAGLFLSSAWLAGAFDTAGADARRAFERVLVDAGFTVEHFDVRGAARTDVAEIRRRLLIEPGEVIFHLDPESARDRVAALPWVREAFVARLLPDRVVVVVEERAPLALWRRHAGAGLSVLDDEGHEIAGAPAEAHAGLMIVEGEGAPDAVAELALALRDYPELASRAAFYRRVEGRRWSVIMRDGAEVLLPERAAGGLARLSALHRTERVLDWPIEALDLRNGDLVIRARPAPAMVLERGA